MMKNNFKIENIPAVLWGDKSDKLFVVVHGNMSHKADDSIIVFAEEATAVGYQVLSFDYLNMVTVRMILIFAKFKTVFKTLIQL